MLGIVSSYIYEGHLRKRSLVHVLSPVSRRLGLLVVDVDVLASVVMFVGIHAEVCGGVVFCCKCVTHV